MKEPRSDHPYQQEAVRASCRAAVASREARRTEARGRKSDACLPSIAARRAEAARSAACCCMRASQSATACEQHGARASPTRSTAVARRRFFLRDARAAQGGVKGVFCTRRVRHEAMMRQVRSVTVRKRRASHSRRSA